MERLFEALSGLMTGALLPAYAGALLWGIASVIFSPCHLAFIPLVVGSIAATADSPGKSAVRSAAFAAGIVVALIVTGAVTWQAGRLLGDIGDIGSILAGSVLILAGALLLFPGMVSIPTSSLVSRITGRGPVAMFLIGSLSGLALGPCTFAYAAPVMAAMLPIAPARPLFATGLVTAFLFGHAGVLTVAGASMGIANRMLHWGTDSKAAQIITRCCGGIVFAAGLVMIGSLIVNR